MLNLPEELAVALEPLFSAIPMEQSMPHLTGAEPKQTALVEEILRNPALANRPELAAGLWLYVDDLERSHTVSQTLETKTGSFWHGIMHRREGDFSNSHYWFRRAAGHPLLAAQPTLDPGRLIDNVSRADGKDAPELVAGHREEWQALFQWCAANS